MSGKGSKRRPQLVSDDELARRWELAFGKRCKACEDPLYDGECKNIDCSEYWAAAERYWKEGE